MYGKIILLIIVFLISGCIDSNQISPSGKISTSGNETPVAKEPEVTTTPLTTIPVHTTPLPLDNSNTTETAPRVKHDRLLIDNISEDMTSFYNKKWYDLYMGNELDCSRMSTYFWKYIRDKYHVAPKIIVSYQRQHAWLALKVGDTGNSSNYRHWKHNNVEYYYLEATIPKIVVDDNQRFLINSQEYTSAEFYNATIYVFDTPQDAGDFHADYSILRGFNQEFVLKKNDLNKIELFLK